MKISIVTVCRNAENCIRETIDSILNQTFHDFEYLIIDGASTDETLKILEEYAKIFEAKSIRYRYFSEPDKGIYDAMNKSLSFVEGEWIQFVNAGDSLFNSKVLSNVFGVDYSDCDVIYGDILIKDNNMYKLDLAGFPDEQLTHSPICHQAMFTRVSVINQYRFNTNYKLAADYDLIIRMNNDGKVFNKIDQIVAVFEMGGTSNKQNDVYLREMYLSRNALGLESIHNFGFSLLKMKAYFFVRNFIRAILPRLFYSEARGWHARTEGFYNG